MESTKHPEEKKMQTFRVVRQSTTTGRVLKVLANGFASKRQAELWLEGFGPSQSSHSAHRVEATEEA